MKRFLSEKVLTRCELAAASLLTVFLVAFHAILFLRAGARSGATKSAAWRWEPSRRWRNSGDLCPSIRSRRAIFFCCGYGMALASERTTLHCAHWVC
ncbi:MAG: hypothetical protein DMF70_07160 [Acidobacteria bacterium]|nr:MAG: hypothetical protein DMF70_07160 [Acidobacteriota bacterium]